MMMAVVIKLRWYFFARQRSVADGQNKNEKKCLFKIATMITKIYLRQTAWSKRSVDDVQTICWLIISKFEHQHDLKPN